MGMASPRYVRKSLISFYQVIIPFTTRLMAPQEV
jgi:hypothetical protein